MGGWCLYLKPGAHLHAYVLLAVLVTTASERMVVTAPSESPAHRLPRAAPQLGQSTKPKLMVRPQVSSEHRAWWGPIPQERWDCSMKYLPCKALWKAKNPTNTTLFQMEKQPLKGSLFENNAVYSSASGSKSVALEKKFFFSFHMKTSHAAALASKFSC